MRSTSVSDTSSATAGTSFSRVTRWVKSARSASTTPGSAPTSYWSRNSFSAAGDVAAHHRLEQVDDAGAVGEAEHVPHVVGAHRPCRMGDRLVEQRERVAHRAFGGAGDQRQRLGLDLDAFLGGDAFEMLHQPPASMRRRSKRWQRDRMVTGTLRISVVAKMNLTCGGGSSSVFSRALKAARREHVHFVDDVDLVARR